METDLVALSKTVAHALRHEPWLYELELDDQGWTGLEVLLISLRRAKPQWRELSAQHIERMIAASTKRRYEIADGRIRAMYGHSVPGRLKRTPGVPPAHLYHGTSPASLDAISRTGLRPMGRQYVHLSVDEETATQVGYRKARQPIILVVDTVSACEDGVQFYRGNEMVWLADSIPWRHIRRRTCNGKTGFSSVAQATGA
jgi:putative RNA 2'-phosphotransferase